MIFLSETCWNFCSQGISYCDVSWRKGTRLHVAVLLLLREIPGGKLGKIPPVSASQAKSRSEQWRWLGLWSLWAGDLLWLDGKQTPNSKELKHWKHLKAHVMWPFPGNWIQPHFWCVYMFFFFFRGKIPHPNHPSCSMYEARPYLSSWLLVAKNTCGSSRIHPAIFGCLGSHWGFPQMGIPLVIIHLNRILHSKPSILGYPHVWKPPHVLLGHLSFVLHLACRAWQGLAVTAGAYAGWQFRQATISTSQTSNLKDAKVCTFQVVQHISLLSACLSRKDTNRYVAD